jgi:hypothetical protein
LKRHLPYLFVFEDYKELMIPNTTNALDGQFSDLKNKLRNHGSTRLMVRQAHQPPTAMDYQKNVK